MILRRITDGGAKSERPQRVSTTYSGTTQVQTELTTAEVKEALEFAANNNVGVGTTVKQGGRTMEVVASCLDDGYTNRKPYRMHSGVSGGGYAGVARIACLVLAFPKGGAIIPSLYSPAELEAL